MKDKQISIRLTADKHARLSTLAWLENSPSAASLLTRLIEDALTQNARRIDTAMALRSPKSSTQSPAPSVSVDGTDSAPDEIEGKLAQIPTPVVEFEGEPEAGNAAAEGTPIPEAQKKSPRENAENSENLTGSAVSTYSQEFTKAAG